MSLLSEQVFYVMNNLILLERELVFLGILDEARKIYHALGDRSALSYVKSIYQLFSKVYHPDLNPHHQEKAKVFQQRLNHMNELLKKIDDEDLIDLFRRGQPQEFAAKRKILVVEDEFGLQETLRDVFFMEGYDVRIAVDGAKGYQTFLAFKPDLVFTDVVMPEVNGIELVRKIRQTTPRIKVIYTSGFFGLRNLKRDLQEETLKFGYPCLSKPYKVSAMLELVDKYLSGTVSINQYA